MSGHGFHLPNKQHSHYQWILVDLLENDEKVHPNSKVFLTALTKWINKE